MLEDLFKQFNGAFAESTIRAYRSDFTHFGYWCEQNTISPVEISPEQLAQYIDQQSQRLASATIRRHVASIGSVLRMSGRRDITKETPVVLALKRMHRKNGEVGDRLNPGSISRLLQDLQLRAGLNLGGRLTGHSFRVGAALDLIDQGETLEEIMLLGGWHAESTVIRYLREWQAL